MLGLDPTVDARELRRHVGLLGHANGLYDDLTAEENVRFTVRAGRLPKAAVSDALARLGISDRLLSLPAGKLSAGQRRRVALAALLSAPTPTLVTGRAARRPGCRTPGAAGRAAPGGYP